MSVKKLKTKKKEETKKKFNPMKQVKDSVALMDRLTDELKSDGATIFSPLNMGGQLEINEDYLYLPSDLTEVASRDLGKYLNAFTQNKAYMRTLYNWQEMQTEDAKRRYYDKYIMIYKEITREYPKLAVRDKELMCNNDDLVKEDFLHFKDQKLKLSMLSNTICSYEEMIFLISREISRRGQDLREFNREDNIK